jgi:hypothetical protein
VALQAERLELRRTAIEPRAEATGSTPLAPKVRIDNT